MQEEIKERKRAEAQLLSLNEEPEQRVSERTKDLELAKKAAEAANQAKSVFLMNMSHELRTPLNAVLSMAGIMTGGESKDKILNTKKIILSSGRSLLNTIEQILEYTRSRDGELKLEEHPFKLSRVLASVKTEFMHKGICSTLIPKICTDGNDIPDDLIGDAECLIKIINPLLENAAKFTLKEPVAALTLKLIEENETGTLIQFSISDNGIGIASEKLKVIFEPFIQADDSSTRAYDGTGMGLAMCRQLVEEHGGKIWAESELGKGSTFHFIIRFQRQARSESFNARTITFSQDDDEDKNEVIADLKTVRPILKKLREALTVFEANKVFICIEKLDKYTLPNYKSMKKSIQNYEYEDALKKLDHICATLGITD